MRVPKRSTARVVFGFGGVLFALMFANAVRIDAMTYPSLANQRATTVTVALLAIAAVYVGIRLALGYPKLTLVGGKLTAHGLFYPRKRTLNLSEYGAATILLGKPRTSWNTKSHAIVLRHLATNKVVVLPMFMFSDGDTLVNSLAADLNEIRGLEPTATDPDAMRVSAENDGGILAAAFLILPLIVVFLVIVFRN